MARVEVKGLDDAVAMLQKMERNVDDAMKKAASAVGDVFVDEIKDQILAYGVKDTGTLYTSVKKSAVKQKGGSSTVEAWPQGMRTDKNHKKGERNETIAFVNANGRKGGSGFKYSKTVYKGRHFMRTAAEQTEKTAAETALRVLTDEINR